MQSGQVSSSERMWAAITHANMVLNVITFFPYFVAITMGIWIFKRRSSQYVGFQALQAFIFQAFAGTIAFLVGTGVHGAIGFLLLIIAILYGMYGSFRCNQGQDFRYLFLGDLLTSMMSKGR